MTEAKKEGAVLTLIDYDEIAVLAKETMRMYIIHLNKEDNTSLDDLNNKIRSMEILEKEVNHNHRREK
jgi:hypothetical protein